MIFRDVNLNKVESEKIKKSYKPVKKYGLVKGKIKEAYIGDSKSSRAKYIKLTIEGINDKRQKVWINLKWYLTNAKGEAKYVRNGAEIYMKGWSKLKRISRILNIQDIVRLLNSAREDTLKNGMRVLRVDMPKVEGYFALKRVWDSYYNREDVDLVDGLDIRATREQILEMKKKIDEVNKNQEELIEKMKEEASGNGDGGRGNQNQNREKPQSGYVPF
jgi:hypothetical protein